MQIQRENRIRAFIEKVVGLAHPTSIELLSAVESVIFSFVLQDVSKYHRISILRRALNGHRRFENCCSRHPLKIWSHQPCQSVA